MILPNSLYIYIHTTVQLCDMYYRFNENNHRKRVSVNCFIMHVASPEMIVGCFQQHSLINIQWLKAFVCFQYKKKYN